MFFIYLNFNGNARQALEFYNGVFGGDLTLTTFADFGAKDSADADAALRRALHLAAAMGADVAVVTAWHREFTRDAASLSETFLTDDDLAGVALALGASAQERLRRIESLHEKFSDLER